VVIHIIPAKLFLKVSDGRVVVDEQKFHTGHLRERFEMLRPEGAAEGGVMSPTG